MKYVKKPIHIEAFCPKDVPVEQRPLWFIENKYSSFEIKNGIIKIYIDTIEGVMRCNLEDYIIKGVDGELYPFRRDIFLKTYEKFEEDN